MWPGLVEVARVHSAAEAELLRALLASSGFAVTLSSRLPSGLWPLRLHEVRVLVKAEDEAEAQDLIARHRQAALAIVPSSAPD